MENKPTDGQTGKHINTADTLPKTTAVGVGKDRKGNAKLLNDLMRYYGQL